MGTDTSKIKYVWLNLNTGEFSNSWDQETHEHVFKTNEDLFLDKATKDNWKLIKYECVNDESFELYNMMKIVSSIK